MLSAGYARTLMRADCTGVNTRELRVSHSCEATAQVSRRPRAPSGRTCDQMDRKLPTHHSFWKSDIAQALETCAAIQQYA